MRNVEGYGLKNGCVADSWSKVRHLSVILSAADDFGGHPDPDGRIPGGLRRQTKREAKRKRKMWIKRSVARR